CLLFLLDAHSRSMQSNVASRAACGHGTGGGVLDARLRRARGVAAAVDADERGEDGDHGRAGEQAQRSVDLESASDAKKKRDCGQSAALADRERLEQVVDYADHAR